MWKIRQGYNLEHTKNSYPRIGPNYVILVIGGKWHRENKTLTKQQTPDTLTPSKESI